MENILFQKFNAADKAYKEELNIKNDECLSIKEFIVMVQDKLKPDTYMKLTFTHPEEKVQLIGKGWVGKELDNGLFSFALADGHNPCSSTSEYNVSLLKMAVANPDMAKIEIRKIKRNEFNATYFDTLDKFLRSTKIANE